MEPKQESEVAAAPVAAAPRAGRSAYKATMLAAAEEENRRNKNYVLPIEVDLVRLLALIGNVQLALRHPGNKGAAAVAVRDFCNKVIGRLEEDGLFAHAEIARMGFEPKYDDVEPAADTAVAGAAATPEPSGDSR